MYLGPITESDAVLDEVPDSEKEKVLVPDVVGIEKLGMKDEGGPELPGSPLPPWLKAVGGGGNPNESCLVPPTGGGPGRLL